MAIYDAETGALSRACMEEIERSLARGWSWGVLTKLCNRKWGTDFRSAALQKAYAHAHRLAAQTSDRRDYAAVMLEDRESE